VIATRLAVWSLLLSFVLAVAACGGDDDGGDAESVAATSAPTDAPSEPDAPATTLSTDGGPSEESTDDPSPEEEPDDSGSAPAENMATVTIGDKTYEFDAEAHLVGRCDPNFFGAFWVIAAPADGSTGNLEMLIVPEGDTSHDETSKIKVGVEDIDGRDWRADEDGGEGTPAGESGVVSATMEGNTVSGTASFVDVYAGDGATAEGTFQVTCPQP